MPVDNALAPNVHAILYRHQPTRGRGRRIVILDSPTGLDMPEALGAACELRKPEVAASLDAAELATLAAAAALTGDKRGDNYGLGESLREVVRGRPRGVLADIVIAALVAHGRHRDVLTVFPGIVGSPAMIAALTEALPSGHMGDLYAMIDVDELVIREVDEARRVLPAACDHVDDHIPTYLVTAMTRGMGWTPWTKLFAILFDARELAAPDAPELPPTRGRYQRAQASAGRADSWRSIPEGDAARAVARLLLDLEDVDALAEPDTWDAFGDRLLAAIGADVALRQAAVEALLWTRPANRRDLALHAAARLVVAGDEAFLDELVAHPDRDVGYQAQSLRDAVFGRQTSGEPWPRPTVAGIAQGLFQLRLGEIPGDADPRTWMGDRLLERLIEQTADAEERRFATAYPDHSEEGEEGLLRSFFSDLAGRFRDLAGGLGAMASATGAARVARINLDYRPVNKPEEGRPGVDPDDGEDTPSFSADLCLIVDPYLDGKPLGKRATLVQAKRQWLRERSNPGRGYATSFALKPSQMSDLTRQTASAHYMFQCAGLAGRGMPMLPARLVADLARNHLANSARIPADMVGPASRSFADWLTYEVLALRTGDPLAELVAKAEGGPGGRARPLARVATVEIAVSVGKGKPRDG